MEIFKKEYCGEEIPDAERDISEAFDSTFNPEVKQIPEESGIPKGTFTITITWEDE